jgi:hypothetical protein
MLSGKLKPQFVLVVHSKPDVRLYTVDRGFVKARTRMGWLWTVREVEFFSEPPGFLVEYDNGEHSFFL